METSRDIFRDNFRILRFDGSFISAVGAVRVLPIAANVLSQTRWTALSRMSMMANRRSWYVSKSRSMTTRYSVPSLVQVAISELFSSWYKCSYTASRDFEI